MHFKSLHFQFNFKQPPDPARGIWKFKKTTCE